MMLLVQCCCIYTCARFRLSASKMPFLPTVHPKLPRAVAYLSKEHPSPPIFVIVFGILLLRFVALGLLYEVPAQLLALCHLQMNFILSSAWTNAIVGCTHFTKDSSSLLFALIGGPVCFSALSPPRIESQAPTNVVPRVAMASCCIMSATLFLFPVLPSFLDA